MLTAEQIARVVAMIRHRFTVTADCEVSMECNPNDLNKSYVESLHRVGINRLSIGVQSVNTGELQLFQRDHDFDQVVQAITAVKESGIQNVSVDLIYGAPGQTLKSWRQSLEKIIALDVPHVSLYALGLEEGTAMHSWVHTGKLPMPDDDLAADMYEMATERLGQAGYRQYEISNWARPGYVCRHNMQYWRNLPYVGVGPGAHGFAGGVRYATILSPHRYIEMMSKPISERYVFPETPATVDAVHVSRHDEIVETLITGLRLLEAGVNRQDFRDRFGVDVVDLYPEVFAEFMMRGLLAIDDATVRVTKTGRLLTNMIFRALV